MTELDDLTLKLKTLGYVVVEREKYQKMNQDARQWNRLWDQIKDVEGIKDIQRETTDGKIPTKKLITKILDMERKIK